MRSEKAMQECRSAAVSYTAHIAWEELTVPACEEALLQRRMCDQSDAQVFAGLQGAILLHSSLKHVVLHLAIACNLTSYIKGISCKCKRQEGLTRVELKIVRQEVRLPGCWQVECPWQASGCGTVVAGGSCSCTLPLPQSGPDPQLQYA